MDKKLNDYYRVFEADHDRRRGQLMDSLPKICPQIMDSKPTVRHFPITLRLRKVLAAAAVLFIVAGVSLVLNQTAPINPQAAWANAVDQAGLANSVHLKCDTGSSSLEMWWRRPNDFRMSFSNGNIMTHNGSNRFSYNAKKNTLVKSLGGTAGFETFILGELGQIFTTNHGLSSRAMKECTLIDTKEVVFKGEKCHELTFEKDVAKGTVFVSIVDARENFIYDLKMFNTAHPEKVLYHVEVLEVDKAMPDSLFTLTPQPGQNMVDRM